MAFARLKHGKLKSVTTHDRRDNILERYAPGEISDLKSQISNRRPSRPVGLGDLVATLAHPIAAAIDAITERMLSAEHKSALAACGACARRQTKLNLLCPDILTCPILGRLLELLPASQRAAILKAAEKHARPPPEPPL